MQLTEDVLRTFGMGRVFKVLACADFGQMLVSWYSATHSSDVVATELPRASELHRLPQV